MTAESNPIAVEFVKFCLKRKTVSDWPSLYDEMCWVASRRLFRGWGYYELIANGVSLGIGCADPLLEIAKSVLASTPD